MEEPILKVISDTETRIVSRSENGMVEKTYKTKPYPCTELTPWEKLDAELGELPQGANFCGSGLFNIKSGYCGMRGEDIRGYNWVEIRHGEIMALAQGQQYGGCSCRFWDSHCDSREYCIKSLAAKMEEKDKIAVLCALRNTIEWRRNGRPPMALTNWIKVTPEAMPPDMEPVIGTIEKLNGERLTYPMCRYNKEAQKWEIADVDYYASGADYWEPVEWDIGGRITHWMPYPDPAED